MAKWVKSASYEVLVNLDNAQSIGRNIDGVYAVFGTDCNGELEREELCESPDKYRVFEKLISFLESNRTFLDLEEALEDEED